MRPQRIAAVLALACCAGCSGAPRPVTPPAPAAAPTRPAPSEIQVFRDTLPTRPYHELGTVSARKRGAALSSQDVLENLKEQARAMGGDALIRLTGLPESGGFLGESDATDNAPEATAMVVRFTDDR